MPLKDATDRDKAISDLCKSKQGRSGCHTYQAGLRGGKAFPENDVVGKVQKAQHLKQRLQEHYR
jgi:hypothetical protein